MLYASAHEAMCTVVEPVEHVLSLTSVVVIAGSYLRYILDDARLARRYVQVGLGAVAAGFSATFLWWPGKLTADSWVRFHETWSAWHLHLMASALMATAIIALARRKGWLRSTVQVALSFLFLGEFLILLNYATNRAYSAVLCPVGDVFYISAVPLFWI